MEWWVVLVPLILIGLITLLIQNFKSTPTNPTYERIPYLLTPAERSFYEVLKLATSPDFKVFSKVRIADILKPTTGISRKNYMRAFNRISSKHFDFVLCKSDDLSIAVVVELDDSSHKKDRAKRRDNFVNRACIDAGLPIARFVAKQSYKVEDIGKEVAIAISNK